MSDNMILLVEDDRLSSAVTCGLLQQAGFTAFTVASGMEALLWAPALPLAAILLDLSLPDMDGGVVALHLSRSVAQQVPVIVLSASEADATLHLEMTKLTRVWQKPLTPDKVDYLRTAGGVASRAFYARRDPAIAGDLARAMQEGEVRLKTMLAAQLAEFQTRFLTYTESELAFAAHALKSAASVMGFTALTSLMSAIESAAARQEAGLSHNRALILDIMAAIDI